MISVKNLGLIMLDREGFRPNVGIILLNQRNQVFWGKRHPDHSWQFPQGGIKHGESPGAGDVPRAARGSGAAPEHVRSSAARATGCATRCPTTSSAATRAATTSGQKQIWFLLRLVGRDSDMNLRATDHPEFDAWRWNDYWVPLDVVIEFKRGGLRDGADRTGALYLPRVNHHNRYLRWRACARTRATAGREARRLPQAQFPARRRPEPPWARRMRLSQDTRLVRWMSSGSLA